jgi:hypothetical protein
MTLSQPEFARAGIFLSVVTLVLLVAVPSRADSLTTSVVISGNGGTTVCGQLDSPNGSLFTSCGGTFTILPGDTTSFAGQAAAKAAFGDLGTGAVLEGSCSVADPSVVNCQAFASNIGFANASFADRITVSNAPSSGLLALTFATSGFNQIACSGLDTCAVARASYSTGNGETLIPNGTSTHTIDFGYSDGSGLIQLFLESDVQCQAGDTFSCGAISNFLDTLQVTGLSVLDANGNLVTGATTTAESGTTYNSGSLAAPEPSSLVTMGTGLIGLLGLSSKRHNEKRVKIYQLRGIA